MDSSVNPTLDPIALIDLARTWRSPEGRLVAEADLRAHLGMRDGEMMTCRLKDEGAHMWLEVILESAIMVTIPCNL